MKLSKLHLRFTQNQGVYETINENVKIICEKLNISIQYILYSDETVSLM